MRISINGKAVETQLKSLKDLLEAEGFSFPCGGKGICGKCRITAPSLAPTPRDNTFLSKTELALGTRLACDKSPHEGLEINCELKTKSVPKKLDECDIIAILGDETVFIGILNGELIESVMIERERGNMPSGKAKTYAVRSVIAHEAIEFFERYGVAKANTIYVVATEAMYLAVTGRDEIRLAAETVPASLFDLPAEEVYLAPGGNAIDFLKKLNMPEVTLAERAVRLATDIRFRTKI